MPSKSTTYDDEQYLHILETMEEDQSFSDRVRELLDLGIEAESAQQTYSCAHCGQEFGNAGAKQTHENSCPEASG